MFLVDTLQLAAMLLLCRLLYDYPRRMGRALGFSYLFGVSPLVIVILYILKLWLLELFYEVLFKLKFYLLGTGLLLISGPIY